jgi:TRAP-type C4-dicarboxylate transport system permease small subunit
MRQLVKSAATWWAVLGGVVLLSIVFVTTANAGAFGLDKIARLYGANFPALPGYEDFVRLAVSCAGLMFFPYCQTRRGHVSVDIFVRMLPVKVRKVLDATSLVATVVLALFLAYWMALGMMETRADHALSRVLGWPEWPFYLPGILSLVLWGAVAAIQLFEEDPSV